jgi:hypothetical protein
MMTTLFFLLAIVVQAAGAAVRVLPDGVCRCVVKTSPGPCYALDGANGPVGAIPIGTDGLKCYVKACPLSYECSEEGQTFCILKTLLKSATLAKSTAVVNGRLASAQVSSQTSTACKLIRSSSASSILVPYADVTFDEADLLRRKRKVESFKFTFSGSTDWYVAQDLASLES